jgi:hypothetical protein
VASGEFPAEATDLRVDSPVEGVAVTAAGKLQQLVATEHFAGVLQEAEENPELAFGKAYNNALRIA